LGKNDEAERLLLVALEHDPLSVFVEREIGLLLFCTGRFEEAIARFERLSAADDAFARIFLGRSLTFAGRVEEALALFEGMPNPAEDYPAWYALALVRGGRRAEAQALAAAHRGNSHRELFIYAALGDPSGATPAWRSRRKPPEPSKAIGATI
jgi:tetratricopeptide (TPR) repeat protein